MAPFLADLLHGKKNDNGAKADTTSRAIPIRETFEDPADLVEEPVRQVAEANETTDLAHSNDEGSCRDETSEHGDGHVIQEETKTEHSHREGVDSDHE